ncbi:hypothetical protein [Streptomyces sp. NPDC004296]|uniref:hypothetical protein n=1 Tax=Streptomyces sp. NPDC004296 TaxID=3364697 RepID=UPI0036788DDF
MKLPTISAAALLGLAQGVFAAALAALVALFSIGLIGEQFPDAFPAVGRFLERLVQLSSDEYAAAFIRDRLLVFGVIGVAFLLWVTHKWPTLVKTIGQALNPFARVGVAAVSAVAAVLVALILAGPLGQAKTKGECTSSFRLRLDHAPSLVSNTACGEGGHGRAPRH